MHLCEPCRSLRDWDNDPAVKAKVDRNLQQTDEHRKARCGSCRVLIRNPLFQHCARCAEKAEICQHCSKSMLTPEERETREAEASVRDDLIDLYTHVVKTYGISAARELIYGMRGTFSDLQVQMLILLDFRDIDYGRERRPIWTKALGTNVYRARFCDGCLHLPTGAPAIVKASQCGHFTTARSSAYCPVCAADQDACEACGMSHE